MQGMASILLSGMGRAGQEKSPREESVQGLIAIDILVKVGI